MKVCLVDGCYLQAMKRGFCNKHYKRLVRHGDPLKGRTENGHVAQFVLDLLNHNSAECVLWTYSKNVEGYGLILIDGKLVTVHNVINTIINGPRPTPKHQTRHLCGNKACVNPKHLVFGTQSENQMDRVAHGTSNRGEQSGKAKLSNNDVIEIMDKISLGRSLREISREYCISECVISNIKAGRGWSWLTGISRS